MSARAETTVRVTDRRWGDMAGGARFERWPGDVVPARGTRVVVFDRDLEFTQHDVLAAKGHSVRIGPAIPWPERNQ